MSEGYTGRISTLIVDDEPVARSGLQQFLEKTAFLELSGTAANVFEAEEHLRAKNIALIFLDIEMPDLSGLQWFRTLATPPQVIFTTAHREFAAEGFEVNALDYLVKPFSFARFFQAAQKARSFFENKGGGPASDQHFFVKADHQYVKVQFSDILFVESSKDYIFIHTPERKLMALMSLKQVEKQLPAHLFLRVHRSFLVAREKVEGMEGGRLLIGDHKVPVSRNLQEPVFKELIADRLWKR